jgi:hypothetical protein
MQTYSQRTLPQSEILSNEKVRVTEITYPLGIARQQTVRKNDQVIVFLEECSYERTDPETGAKTIRRRKAGEVIWHERGEAAPRLLNAGEKDYRVLVVELLDR